MKQRFDSFTLLRFSFVALLLLASAVTPVIAEEHFLTAHCKTDFPEAMSHLQELIKKQGYTISRIQRVDKGLEARGYETGKYRVVFFGKTEQILEIRTRYPAFIPYLPLSITIFEDLAEADIGISTIDPITFDQLYKSDMIKNHINSWHVDLQNIFSKYQSCEI